MRKTFKRPDGSDVTVEGTPEELAEYEKKIQEENRGHVHESGKKPGVLRGAEVDGIPLSDGEVNMIRAVRAIKENPMGYDRWIRWPDPGYGVPWPVTC